MEQENKKNNFFKNFLKSIKDLDKYEDFAIESPKTAFKYFLKLILIFVVIIAIFYTYQIMNNTNKVYSNLVNKIPDFSYSQGSLNINSQEPIIIDDYKDSFGKIIIDTNISENEIEKYEKESGILFLKDKCIVLSNTMGSITYNYADLASNYNITEFTKQDIIEYVQGLNIVSVSISIYLVIAIYLFMVYFISILIDVLLLSLLALLISRISRIRLKYAPSFAIAIHSISLPVLLNLIYIIVNLLIGFRIKYFQLMYSIISYIYVIVAVLMIKTDFTNRQTELIRLAEEQKRVKEQMKQKQEEEKQKEENKKPKDEKKPETEEKKNKGKKKNNDKEDGIGADAPACQEIQKP